MARRGGKAASRRSRQRRSQRAQPTSPPQAAQPAAEPQRLPADEVPRSSDGAPSTDAFEAADAELRASTPPPGSRSGTPSRPSASVRARVSDFHMGSGGPSRLTERAAAEYHYVARDLRNIAVLMVVLVVLLAASAVIVNLLDIGQAS